MLLDQSDIGKIFTYIDIDGSEQRGKLVSFDNDKKIAFIDYSGEESEKSNEEITSYKYIKELNENYEEKN